MPFGPSSLAAPKTCAAVSEARWAAEEAVSVVGLHAACPTEGREAAVAAVASLKRARADCVEGVVVSGAKRLKSSRGASVPGRSIRVVRAAAVEAAKAAVVSPHAATYAVAPGAAAWTGLWRRDAAAAARLFGDDSDEGAAARSAKTAVVRPASVVVEAARDWADPTGEVAAAAAAKEQAEAKATAERQAARAAKGGGALPAALGGLGKAKARANGHAALFGGASSKKKKPAAKAAPKKRRVVVDVDDEDEDDDDDDDADGSSVGVEPPRDDGGALPEGLAEPEDEAPAPAPEPTKKGMKLVDKTYVDKDGYFCTQQVWVPDESGGASAMAVSAPKAKPALPKPSTLPKAKPKAAPKKLKKGQTSLSSFFKKK